MLFGRAIEQSPYRERIHIAGFREDACAIVAACGCSVLASTKREGLPKTVIEAMACGVPPIVTDTGGSPELVIDGECGLVVRPGNAVALADAIRRLAERRYEAAEMGRKARERIAKHFNIEQTIARTLSVYESVLAE